jgi:hypothetical protein
LSGLLALEEAAVFLAKLSELLLDLALLSLQVENTVHSLAEDRAVGWTIVASKLGNALAQSMVLILHVAAAIALRH